ncbi:MAG: class I SAM-dependent methyltransferase, partial [Candidatus Margulisbacteria bacterium]|nr:class I SAM-dependent methyltransferase [Candidatus Margulisiibacteriota bacterium]
MSVTRLLNLNMLMCPPYKVPGYRSATMDRLNALRRSGYKEIDAKRPWLFSLLNKPEYRREAVTLLRFAVDTSVPLTEEINEIRNNDPQAEEFALQLVNSLANFTFVRDPLSRRVCRFHLFGIPFYVLQDGAGYMFNEGRPGEDYLDLIYSDRYYRSCMPRNLGFFDFALAHLSYLYYFERTLGSMMSAAIDKVGFMPSGTDLLDVGAGLSEVSILMKDAFHFRSVNVLDRNESLRSFWESLGTVGFYSSFEALRSIRDDFTAVICLSTFEHTVKPMEFLADLRSVMKKKGILFMILPETPTIG